jgi:hypothetical protein
MELSAGGAVSGDTWQLSPTDLPYAWIAPPDGFVGSADLVAELRLSNGKIVDRQAMHIEWTPVSPAPARSEFDTQLQPRQDVQPQRITDPPHDAFLPLPQVVPQSSGAKGITVESRAEPGIANSTCFASAAAVRQDHPRHGRHGLCEHLVMKARSAGTHSPHVGPRPSEVMMTFKRRCPPSALIGQTGRIE